ncbi:lysine exporter LysO family protein [Moraxella nasovis]|uniref:lysine exporter LysO family protein n=1 Tax=Moraxella nasovis TaxID=2904121 RepID=UPI001F621216|nr:lysine exporter LysO family protein [Moraxella nasovis]UNU73424.1 lysine exporter LysO family protein [Moraxella nasovis]
MNGIFTLILIITPMFIGFALPVADKHAIYAEKIINYLVFLLLIVIGIEIGLEKDIVSKVYDIATYLITLFSLTIGFGLVGLALFDRISPCQYQTSHAKGSTKINIHGSLLQLFCLLVGFILALVLPSTVLPPRGTTTALLMLLLLFVGIGLKGVGIGLRAAMLNQRGLYICVIFTASILLAGAVFSLIFDDVSLFQGLALAAGSGWYSLSAPLMTEAYGAMWGSVALLNDLGREIAALIFIPWVMRYSSSAAIGLGGVTSLDFTLPILSQSGGTRIVPLVVSYGFLINIISPILMVFFSSLG